VIRKLTKAILYEVNNINKKKLIRLVAFFQALISVCIKARQIEPSAHSMYCIFTIKLKSKHNKESPNNELVKRIVGKVRVIFCLQMFKKKQFNDLI
jgi:hypothetical protein